VRPRRGSLHTGRAKRLAAGEPYVEELSSRFELTLLGDALVAFVCALEAIKALAVVVRGKQPHHLIAALGGIAITDAAAQPYLLPWCEFASHRLLSISLRREHDRLSVTGAYVSIR
jgi:hypothetical protein